MGKETMSDDTRREILAVLDDLMHEHPEWRIGQLVANMAFLARQTNSATWDVENVEFIQTSRQHLQRMADNRKANEPAMQKLKEMHQKAILNA